MSERPCIRGCTVADLHYATCPDYGNPDGKCRGCVAVEARDGVLLCDRCYGRLRRRFEVVPDLIAHLRSLADPLKATRYDRVLVQGGGPTEAPAPVAADLLDACTDIMRIIGAGALPPGTPAARAYTRVMWTIGALLESFDYIANDAEAIEAWWPLMMSHELAEDPDVWTVGRALARWPLEDRKKWAKQPCPECGLRAVKITPPRHRLARTWFVCESCGWRKTEKDDDGLWAAAFGQYAEAGREGSNMEKLGVPDLDLTEAIRAGVQYVIENADSAKRAGAYGLPAAAIVGAVPALAEQFATLADNLAAFVRGHYQNGDLMAGGARLVATAIRDAVKDGDGTAILALLAEPVEAEATEVAA